MSIETYLGFDVGTKRTGVAIANNLISQAVGIEVVLHHQHDATNWARFDKIINAHQVNLFIVGLPFDQDGKAQKMTFIAKAFAKKLEARYGVKAAFIDEYLSSFAAKSQLKYNHSHPNAQRGDVDKRSAQLILQTWLNEKILQGH